MNSPHLILEISLGPHRGKKAVLPPGTSLKVGRGGTSDFVISDDAQLSAAHFELHWDGTRGSLRDLRGIASTRLNGETVIEGDVAHGAWIRAGATDFMVYVEGHTPPPPDEAAEAEAAEAEAEEAGAAPEEDEEPPPFAAEAPEPSPEDDIAAEAAAEREQRERARKAQAAEQRNARKERAAREEAAARALPILRKVAAEFRLHAILDAARTPRILEALHEAREEHRSLYEGAAGEALDEVAPQLVRLAADSRLLSQLVREGWGRRWGIFAEGDVPKKEMRRHLRRFLMVEDDETGERLYFRFYDPGVLREFWRTCSRRQVEELIGPLRAFLVEGERGEVLRLTADGKVEAWSGLG
jgi:hypothetical protein